MPDRGRRRGSVGGRWYTCPVLSELRVENLLLIERAELRLGPGLTVLTGETGAGKTVLAHALDLLVWPAGGAVLSAPRRAGLAAALRYRAEHGHLRVPTDYEDAYGYRLGAYITGQRTAYQAGALEESWIAELEALGMIWDEHEAAWQGHMATVEAYLDNDGNVAATAKQLFTHRHTVRYRLERVRELCGHDVSATEGREKLGLGLKAMRVLGIASPRGPALEPGAGGGKVARASED